MNILFLSRWFPYPQDNGSKIRIHNILTNLAKSNDVTLVSFVDQAGINPDSYRQYSKVSNIEVVPWKPYSSGSLKAILGLFKSTPRFILDTYSLEMDSLIRNIIKQSNFDLICASQLSMASYFSCFGGIPAIFEELELGLFLGQAEKSNNLFKRFRHNLTWLKLRQYLSRLLDSFIGCTVVSDQERKLFVQNFPLHQQKVEIIPNCVQLKDYEHIKANPTPNQLIFTGSFRYHANYEAMLWFIREIFPIILEQLPDTKLIITGDHNNQSLPSIKNIILTGYIEDIKPVIASAWVSIAPLLVGGGTRLKILEAMAIGVPVVSTSKGAEGLDVNHGEHMFIADSSDEFANQVIAILRNRDLRDHLVTNAKHLIKEKYNWENANKHFLQMIEQAISG